MANGAIGPFRGESDNEQSLTREDQAIQTIQAYYERVWNQGDVNAIDDLVADKFVIHRNREVRKGRDGLKAQVTEAIANFLELRIDVTEIVALRDANAALATPSSTRTIVAVSLDILHNTIAGDWIRRRTLDISIVDAGLIVETSVRYGDPEVVPAPQAPSKPPTKS